MKKLLLAAVLALASTAALSQDAPVTAPRRPPGGGAAPAAPAAAPLPDADPALWVVRDADTTIYLFGTIHLLDGRPWFNDEVKTAFDASDSLVMEAILPADPMSVVPTIMRYGVDSTGRKLSDRLTPAENQALVRAVAPLGIPAAVFDRFEPWFASMMLSATAAQRSGLDAANGVETILTRAAAERNMPVGELEGIEWQVRLFDNMPEVLQPPSCAARCASSTMPARCSRRCSRPGRPATPMRWRGSWKAMATAARFSTGSCSPTATRPGRAGSTTGWSGPARCSSPSAPPISPAATASRRCSRRTA